MQGRSRVRPAGRIEGSWFVNILAIYSSAVDSRHVDHLVKLQIPCSIDLKMQITILESMNWMV